MDVCFVTVLTMACLLQETTVSLSRKLTPKPSKLSCTVLLNSHQREEHVLKKFAARSTHQCVGYGEGDSRMIWCDVRVIAQVTR